MSFTAASLYRIMEQLKEQSELMLECLYSLDRSGFLPALNSMQKLKDEIKYSGYTGDMPTIPNLGDNRPLVMNAIISGIMEGDELAPFLSCLMSHDAASLIYDCNTEKNCPDSIKVKLVEFEFAKIKLMRFFRTGDIAKNNIEAPDFDTFSRYDGTSDPVILQAILDIVTHGADDKAKSLCAHGFFDTLLGFHNAGRLTSEMKGFIEHNKQILSDAIDVVIQKEFEASMRIVDIFETGLTNITSILDLNIDYNDTSIAFYALTRMGMKDPSGITSKNKKNPIILNRLPVLYLDSQYSADQCQSAFFEIYKKDPNADQILTVTAEVIHDENRIGNNSPVDVRLSREKLAHTISLFKGPPKSSILELIETAGIRDLVLKNKTIKNAIFESELGL